MGFVLQIAQFEKSFKGLFENISIYLTFFNL